jgi:hypothetical protein
MLEQNFVYVKHLGMQYSLYFQPFNATRISASGLGARVNQLETEKDKRQGSKGGFWDEFEVYIYNIRTCQKLSDLFVRA